MSFHFECPRGHLLEGDASQAGQSCTCPVCGMLFLIPPPLPEEPATVPEPQRERRPQSAAPVVDPEGSQPPEFLHIPCPNGHELETPREMLDQDALCPYCNARFRLRESHSIEYRRRQEIEDQRRARRAGRFWLNLAIIAAILVVLGLGLMLLSSL